MNTSQRMQLFLAVRDLPYCIGTAANDTSCVGKTKLLGELLVRIGLDCQVWKATVAWEATGIPPELLSFAPRKIFNHFFLKVRIPETGKWTIVDATWDQRLRDALPVNDWDGQGDTTLAYPSQELEKVGSVQDFTSRNFDPQDQFIKRLNEWYQSLAERK